MKGSAIQVFSEVRRVKLWIGRPGRIATKWSSISDTDYRRNSFRSHLLTARAHAGAARCTHGKGPATTPSPHPSRRSFGTTRRIRLNEAGSHLGSTLKPGRAVLTLGVFRRSRSVAYIRVDASPSEVHTKSMVTPAATRVNSPPADIPAAELADRIIASLIPRCVRQTYRMSFGARRMRQMHTARETRSRQTHRGLNRSTLAAVLFSGQLLESC